MRVDITFLRSKVARRIFVLFVCCALVPILVLSFISFQSVSRELNGLSQRQLRQASKAEGMEEYQRLRNLEAEMEIVALHLLQGASPAIEETFAAHFTAAARFRPAAPSQHVILGHGLRLPVLSSEQESHLRAGKSLLTVGPCDGRDATCANMIRLLDAAHPQAGMLMAEINPGYLWDPEKTPPGVQLCVYAGQQALRCQNDGELQKAVETLEHAPEDNRRVFSWQAGEVSYQSAYWRLFLKPSFMAEDWIVIFSQRGDESLAPMRHFRATLTWVIVLAVLAVVLLSSIQIRRTLVPLERLAKGVERIGAQHFETRVNVRSGDEFEHVADCFNDMASRLGKQFHALRTVQDIDQAILATLNRAGIIAAVLQHMPDLLPHGCFAVALLSDPECQNQASLSFTIPGEDLSCRQVRIQFSERDLEELRRHHDAWRTADGEPIPDFLTPLSVRGMAAFVVWPLQVDGKLFGAIIGGHPYAIAISDEDLKQTRQVADQLSVAFSNVQLMEALEQLHWGALNALARAIDAKSAWTSGHSERVTQFAIRIGRALGLPPRDLAIMHRGGLLHDIGKIGIPPEILDKPGRLEASEMDTMRDHVRIGMRILEPIPSFREALPIVAQHHEWFDGRGYPAGLKGEEISLHARIFAVADCYDALISDRPYRRGLPREKVVSLIKSGAGTQFDPGLIEVFLRMCAEEPESAPAPGESETAQQPA